MEMNVPPLAESTHRDRSIFLRHRLFPDDIQHGQPRGVQKEKCLGALCSPRR